MRITYRSVIVICFSPFNLSHASLKGVQKYNFIPTKQKNTDLCKKLILRGKEDLLLLKLLLFS